MTPVEDVALAITAAMVATNSDPEAMARAALLALAEAPIPEAAIQAAEDACQESLREERSDGLIMNRTAFRAMLRALAKEESQ